MLLTIVLLYFLSCFVAIGVILLMSLDGDMGNKRMNGIFPPTVPANFVACEQQRKKLPANAKKYR